VAGEKPKNWLRYFLLLQKGQAGAISLRLPRNRIGFRPWLALFCEALRGELQAWPVSAPGAPGLRYHQVPRYENADIPGAGPIGTKRFWGRSFTSTVFRYATKVEQKARSSIQETICRNLQLGGRPIDKGESTA
jgi:hypothetical protein